MNRSWTPITTSQASNLTRTTPSHTNWLPEIDMARVRDAVANRRQSVVVACAGSLKLDYYNENNTRKVYIHPAESLVPCGHFIISRLLER